MGYFDRAQMPPAIPVPAGLRVWDDGRGRLTLAWRRPLGRCDGYAVLGGPAPDQLAELALLSPAAACWPVAPGAPPWLAVACVRGDARGEPSAPIAAPGHAPEPEPAPAPHQPPAPEPSALDAPLVCACCAPPRPLAPDDGALTCPASGELYAVLPTGALARAAELPFGLCRCCEARQPLIRSGEAIVCLGRPGQEYIPLGGRYVPRPPEAAPASPLADADAIDAALRANSALLSVNGVFVHAPPPDRWER